MPTTQGVSELQDGPAAQRRTSYGWLRVEPAGQLEVHLAGYGEQGSFGVAELQTRIRLVKDGRFSRSPCCLAGAHKGEAGRPHNPWVVGSSPTRPTSVRFRKQNLDHATAVQRCSVGCRKHGDGETRPQERVLPLGGHACLHAAPRAMLPSRVAVVPLWVTAIPKLQGCSVGALKLADCAIRCVP